MFDLDVNEQNILNITEGKKVLMEVHGVTKTYRPVKLADGTWEMEVVGEENTIYGLSCDSIKEVRATLLVDYTKGIITKVFF